MGAEVHCKTFSPEYYLMKDFNEESTGSRWALFHGGRSMRSGQIYNGFMPSITEDAYVGYNKDLLKQKMLEHEAIFKNQVCELHRLYRIQRDMMEEIKRMELRKRFPLIETSSSSAYSSSQVPHEEGWKRYTQSFKLENCGYAELVSVAHDLSAQTCRSYTPNNCRAKGFELLEPRASKVRKKLFDLHLPADEYIDTEQSGEHRRNNLSDISSNASRNHKNASKASVQWFIANEECGRKTDYQEKVSTSHLYLENPLGLSDLNEPIQADETAPPSVNFLGCYPFHEIRGLDLSSKLKIESLGLPKSNGLNPCRSSNGTLSDRSANAGCVERELFSFVYKEGNRRENLNSVAQSLQQDKLSPAKLDQDRFRDEAWSQRKQIGCLNRKNVESIVDSHSQRAPTFLKFSGLTTSCFQPVSSLGKSLTQKSTEVDTHPSSNSLTSVTISESLVGQKHESFGAKWCFIGNSSLNPGVGGDIVTKNEFSHGSSSRCMEASAYIAPGGFNLSSCNRNENMMSVCSFSREQPKFPMNSNFVDLNYANSKGFPLRRPGNEMATYHNIENVDGKDKGDSHFALLPRLRAEQSCKSEAVDTKELNTPELRISQASSTQVTEKSTNVKVLNSVFTQSVILASATQDNVFESDKTPSPRKILGFSMFENSCPSKKQSSLLFSDSATIDYTAKDGSPEKEGKHRLIDINVPCDPLFVDCEVIDVEAPVVDNAVDTKDTYVRSHVDLNSCFNEEEDLRSPSFLRSCSTAKAELMIDLEAPAIPESEEDVPFPEEHGQHADQLELKHKDAEQIVDEFIREAAEAIVAISSSGEYNHMEDHTIQESVVSLTDPLLWFVEIVSSFEADLKNKYEKESNVKYEGSIKKCSSHEIDYFEVMTLHLEETKEEEYMPIPFVPEFQKLEEKGVASFPNRGQKIYSKRGRQRRDFQRDILPGLVSLSRHEITEDLQTFGKLMKDAGCPWNSTLTRRHGTRSKSGRGRRQGIVHRSSPELPSLACSPLMKQLKNMNVGLGDGSLTGWGKTTRRPRRQRFPAANPPIVVLT